MNIFAAITQSKQFDSRLKLKNNFSNFLQNVYAFELKVRLNLRKDQSNSAQSRQTDRLTDE